ncbi:hypothetical protein H1235_15370 [Pseudoxanthomonas sp. NC8]|nr:hypothetical protein H1235_15370 [Pseudoxanthomonas sp. NC8]
MASYTVMSSCRWWKSGRVQRSTTRVWSLVGLPFSSSQMKSLLLSRRPTVSTTRVWPSQRAVAWPK